ncbi:MAG: prephenate/arogenate dehydrogenase [Prochloraceae cyanobacterium]|nr:prephenate/arogenate dehydrogenase [Prochloraceae cyanobacterium]
MKLGIVGLGLIGGSLGLDLRDRGFEVLGVSRRQSTCDLAVAMGVADRASLDLSLLAEADLIFICTPIAKIAPTIEQLIPYLRPETIITDVGSVKAPIVSDCAALWDNFVGGHPMAGTANSGVEAAERNLFQGATYVITPTEKTSVAALNKVKDLACSLGSSVIITAPTVHDRAVAWISHLPVMVSAGLISAVTAETDSQALKLAISLASSGFRDTSRVGGGNPELGLMMAQYNREELLRSMKQYRHNLDRFIELIEAENWQALEDILKSTRAKRPDFL